MKATGTKTLSTFICVPLLLLLAIAGQGGSCRGDKSSDKSSEKSGGSSSKATDSKTTNASNRNGVVKGTPPDAPTPGGDEKAEANSSPQPARTPLSAVARIPEGGWGGVGIQLVVRGDGAEIEYDCANGSLDGPLALDGEGNFSINGTHTREHGGPIRINEKSQSRPARYTGRVQGQSMSLTVTIDGASEALGTFTLTRGTPGRLRKCR